MNRSISDGTLATLAQRRANPHRKQSRRATAAIEVLKAKHLRDGEEMDAARVYGPYKARNGYRMVVVEGAARKSIVVPSVEAGEKLRQDLETALLGACLSNPPKPDRHLCAVVIYRRNEDVSALPASAGLLATAQSA